MKRVRRLKTGQLFVIGLVAGLLFASVTAIVSARRYSEPSLYLLGSGDGISALATIGTQRILIANGNDPASLATAFRAARPEFLRRIDIVVLMPGASERVAERAVEIASPRRIYALPYNRLHPGDRIDGLAIRPMDGPSVISGSSDATIRIDPGTGNGWRIEFRIGDALVGLYERVPFQTTGVPEAVIIMSAPIDDSIIAVDAPLVFHPGKPDPDLPFPETRRVVSIDRNQVVRIEVTPSKLIVSGA